MAAFARKVKPDPPAPAFDFEAERARFAEVNGQVTALRERVEILKRAGDRDVVIGEASAGEIIGEMAIIDVVPRMASARAVVDTVLAPIPRDDLKARLDRLEKIDPVLRRLMSMFMQRMRDTRFTLADS